MIASYFDKNAIFNKILRLNKNLILLVCMIFFCGLMLLYSANNGNMKPWAIRQLLYFVCFFPVMIAIAVIDLKFWLKSSYLIYIGGLFLLVLVAIIGHKSMGATRWLNLGFIRIQPSEIMKICMTLALARYFFQNDINDIRKNKKLIIPTIMYIIPFCFILKQPNLGTVLILTAIFVATLFFVGVQFWKFVLCFVIALLMIPITWKYGLHDYQKQRVITFLNPESDPLNSGYNITQSKIAIGSGGIWGTGFLKGVQGQLEFLPEKHTDFIFAVLAEEFGFIGSVFVISLFLVMFIFFAYIITKCNHSYGKIIVMGVFVNIFCHFFINIGMITGILPVVGIPLPMLSYGGSITVSTLISIGFVLNVDINRNTELSLLD
ncbi:MAG: rod shape-determining protein RodA [Rickettsiales bacterium]|nr:rod shape-determining protein RodA [Rickettsiales bacterium]